MISGSVLGPITLIVAGVVSWGLAIKSVVDNWNLVVDVIYAAGVAIKNSVLSLGGKIHASVIEPIKNFFSALPEAFSNLWEGFKAGISNIGSMLYDQIFGSVRRAISSVRSLVSNVPILGNLFGEETPSAGTLGSAVGQTVSETRTTTTSRFSVDFKNMPRGVQVTAPEKGDFDWSRGYVLGGV